ncbi:MAG: MotA/TolQ/ExbB proton channel family protein, partial [Lachnospiraceae bacterium]|nr:MotA/TolQ/ExbB proton channel family protein [Lachnospiraceae bacterium]
VNMLYNMSDAASIGPAMAVALLTTMYGSLIANWICLPATFKMKKNNAAESMIKEIMIEGLLSIQAGENPRVIEEKLKSFLSPQARAAATPESSGEE